MAKKKYKVYTVTVIRYYGVTDEIVVSSIDEESAKMMAQDISNNTDYTGQLQLDRVSTEVTNVE